jgi:hypothetical protein
MIRREISRKEIPFEREINQQYAHLIHMKKKLIL